MKKAFTMIELVFVLVILGILSAVALPKFNSTRTFADVSKGRTDVSTIRASILTERQSQLIKGENSFIPKLSKDKDLLFTGDGDRTLLTYGIVSGTTTGKWSADGDTLKKYIYKSEANNIKFTYDNETGIFNCDRGDDEPTEVQQICRKLVD